MSAVWYRARAGLRHSWITTLGLVLFVALPFGIVLATTAGARRAHDALPEFLAYYQPYDTLVYVAIAGGSPGSADRTGEMLDAISALPQWAATEQGGAAVVSIQDGDRWLVNVASAHPEAPPERGLERPIIVEGRRPDPRAADEVAVNEAMARDLGLHPGDTFELRTVSNDNLEAVSNGAGDPYDPAGRQSTMTVAAVVRNPTDLVTAEPFPSEMFTPESWRLELGPAFVEAMGDDLANYGYGVAGRVRPGEAEALATAVHEVGGDSVQVAPGNEDEQAIAAIGRGIDVETNALALFALLALVTAVVLVGQSIGRRAALDLDDAAALRSTGLLRRQRVLVPLVRSLVVAGAGTAGAVALAIALSPLFPIGVAHRAEIDPGLDVDPLVIGLGAAALVLVLMAWAGVASWRASRGLTVVAAAGGTTRSARPLSALAASAGAPVSVVEGVRMSFARGRGRTAVPVFSAVVATTAAVAALSAILVFSASLDHLVASPQLQGWNWDVTAGNLNTTEGVHRAARALRDSDVVESFVGFGTGPLEIDGQQGYGAFFGPGAIDEGAPVLDGRLPAVDGEVAVGTVTLDKLGKQIGDTVSIRPGPGFPAQDLRIVGTVIPPAGLDTQLTLGEGAVFTLEGGRALAPQFGLVPQSFLIRFTPGTSVAEGTAALQEEFGDAIGPPHPPTDIRNLSRVQRLPRLLALLVALMALGTLANVLVTSIRRHRRDLATLAAVGFRRRQLATTVAAQATTFAALALLVGIPLGVAAGRTVWTVVADSISSSAAPVTPLLLLGAVAAASVVAVNLIAALPARAAARTRPARILRSE